MSKSKSPTEWLYTLLNDFDKTCPKCQGLGNGGDGCTYCWAVNVEKEAIDTATQAILNQVEELVGRIIGDDEWVGSEHDQLRNVRAKLRNQLRAEQRTQAKQLLKGKD